MPLVKMLVSQTSADQHDQIGFVLPSKLCCFLLRVTGVLEPIPAVTGKGQGTSWTGHQSITALKIKQNHTSVSVKT